MVDCHHSPHLLGAMDRLWFQQIILSPPVEPIQHPPATKTNFKPLPETPPTSDCIMCTNSSPNLESTLLDHEPLSTISDSSPNLISIKDSDDLEKEKDEEMKMDNYKMKRPKRLSLLGSKTRSRLSSPSLQHTLPTHITRNRVIDVHGNIITSSPSMSKLRKTMSCKSLWELEYEEVKGFMDLGFRFDKEQICPRMMSVIPGLQRLDSLEFQELISSSTSTSSLQEENEEEEEEVVERPYLSEAWLIKKPNSPLLNLRMPHVTASNDMKNHLKFWARTVACAVQLEV